MKQTIYLSLALLIAFCSCGKNESKLAEQTTSVRTIERSMTVDASGIVLPKGTKIEKCADDTAFKVELPEGYAFLTTASKPLPVRFATYKCVCSGSGSTCRVFYQEDLGGFGCMHKNCTGSCTGSFTANGNKVLGVINTTNDEISARKDQSFERASLGEGGMEQFFSSADVQLKIKEQYEILYRHLPVPDFDELEKNPSMLKDYVYVAIQLYGVSFYLLAPHEIKELGGVLKVVEATSASCDCSSAAGGTCEKKSKGMLGYRAYWCIGTCNGCALTVND